MGQVHNLSNKIIYGFIVITFYGSAIFVHKHKNISDTCKLWYKGAIGVEKVCIKYYSNHSDFLHLLVIQTMLNEYYLTILVVT